MKDIVRGVVTVLSETSTYVSKERVEALVFMCLCERGGRIESGFTIGEFGVSSNQVDSILNELCDRGVLEEKERATFGEKVKYSYRSVEHSSVPDDVKQVCETYGEIPVSNLHMRAVQRQSSGV